MNNWSKEKTLLFISLVRERPVIWNATSLEHTYRIKRCEALEEVAQIMGISLKEARVKWLSLRSQFKREKKRSGIRMDSGKEAVSKQWFAFKAMRSLMRFDTPLNLFPSVIKNEKQIMLAKAPTISEISMSSTLKSSEVSPALNGIVKKDVGKTCIYSEVLKTLQAIKDKKRKVSDMGDDITSYGLYIAAQIRKFKPNLQCKAKYEIHQLLYRLEMENLKEE